MTPVEIGQNYKMVWEGLEHVVNISYKAAFTDVVSRFLRLILILYDFFIRCICVLIFFMTEMDNGHKICLAV